MFDYGVTVAFKILLIGFVGLLLYAATRLEIFFYAGALLAFWYSLHAVVNKPREC